ncbi:hypothetical protein, partial [Aquimarina sp. Aq78]
TSEMSVWIRYSSGGVLDIDLCDQEGKICVQLYGVGYQEVIPDFVEDSSNQQEVIKPLLKPEEIQNTPKEVFLPLQVNKRFTINDLEIQKINQESIAKPSNVSLLTPETLKIEETSGITTSKAQVSLSGTEENVLEKPNTSSIEPLVKLFDHDRGLYSLVISTSDDNTLSSE